MRDDRRGERAGQDVRAPEDDAGYDVRPLPDAVHQRERDRTRGHGGERAAAQGFAEDEAAPDHFLVEREQREEREGRRRGSRAPQRRGAPTKNGREERDTGAGTGHHRERPREPWNRPRRVEGQQRRRR